MKKIYFVIFILFPFSFFGQTVDFRIEYKPQTKYVQKIEQNIEAVLQYSGSESFLEKLKDKEIENPTVTKIKNNTESVCKSGKLKKDGSFPLTIEFLSSTNSDNKTLIPNGTTIYGNGTISEMPKLDSIVSKDMDETFKNNLLQTLQSTYSQFDLPKKQLKIGESFSTENPLTIPFSGLSLEMIVTTTYKLVNVANKTAGFDISVLYTMKIAVDKYNLQGTGTGSGKMDFDITNHFPTKYSLETDMEFGFKQAEFSLQTKSKNSFYQTTQILKN